MIGIRNMQAAGGATLIVRYIYDANEADPGSLAASEDVQHIDAGRESFLPIACTGVWLQALDEATPIQVNIAWMG